MNSVSMKLPGPFPEAKPRISGNAVLAAGLCLYGMVLLWPPLTILVTFILYQIIPYSFREGDDAAERRKQWNDYLNEVKFNPDYKDLQGIVFPNSSEVQLDESYWVNPRGLCLHTSVMRPANGEVKAVVCCCHGYSDLSSFLIRYEYQRLVRDGIAVISLDYEGHGRSDGALCYIPNWNYVIEDATVFFRECYQKEFRGKKCFLIGQSMGGAVAFDVYSRLSSMISGVILVSPMAKISEEMMPNPIVVKALLWILGSQGAERLIGMLPLAPSNDLSSLAYRLEHKRQLAYCTPIIYSRKPRLATARELVLTTQRISQSLKHFDAPFLVLHGSEDKVTDPSLSQALYEESSSVDKDLKIYKDMWHTITSGESEEDIDLVFSDILSWIKARL
mmetsp:Transcript_9908/g.14309  ORF Transcript_9908/g.14309 Transcript_9908/m.14309 type:complete len:390 (-) Transcript_9908:94-1263(-)